jgi:hypothetical protein
MFAFRIVYLGPDGVRSDEPAQTSIEPREWSPSDLLEVLRVAAEHRGIPLETAYATLVNGPDGVTVQLGTTEAGSLTVGPLPIRPDISERPH